jgi:hypothetical protein
MGAGAAALPMILSLGSKLMGGAGGGGSQPVNAPIPTPFDAISGGTPPTPQQNPAFAEDRGLFGGQAEMIGAKPQGTPAPGMPMPGRAPGAPPSNMPMPGRNDLFGGPGAEVPDMKSFVPGEDRMNPELFGGAGPGQTQMKSKPSAMIGPDGGLNNTEAAKRAGYDTKETLYATDVTGQQLPQPQSKLFGGETAPVQAATAQLMPEDEQAGVNFTPTNKKTVVDFSANEKTPAVSERYADDVEDEDNAQEDTGKGLFGAGVGGALGDLQDRLGDSPTNPLFQVAMGLLSSGYDGSNPYATMNKGLGAIPGLQIAKQASTHAENADARATKKSKQDDEDAALMNLVRDLMMKQAAPQAPGANIARGAAKVIR